MRLDKHKAEQAQMPICSAGLEKAKAVIGHMIVIQAAFKPLSAGQDRAELSKAAQANLTMMGIALAPKWPALLGGT